MLDEKDLQAIREIIQESNKQTLQDALQGASVLMESYFEPKFKLLAEGIQGLKETQVPKDQFDELREEVFMLRAVVRRHSEEIKELKHA